jgi:PAS domain S-box-containing protein
MFKFFRPNSIKRRIIWPLIITCSISVALYLVRDYSHIKNTTIKHTHQLMEERVDKMYRLYQQLYKQISLDINFFSNSKAIDAIIRAQKNNGIDPVSNKKSIYWKEQLTNIFLNKSMASNQYNEIRFIGIDNLGKEIIRVNNYEKVEVVKDSKLQSKSHRQYFQKAILASPEKVFFGDISLRKENGKLVKPYTPQIRVSKTIFHKNKIFGLLIININFSSFLSQLHNFAGVGYDWHLVDSFGRYLRHKDAKKQYRDEVSSGDLFQSDFPELASNFLRASDQSRFITTKNQENIVGVFQKFHFDKTNTNRFIGISVFRTEQNVLLDVKESFTQDLLFILSSSLILVLTLYFLIQKEIKGIELLDNHLKHKLAGTQFPKNLLENSTEIGDLAKRFQSVLSDLEDKSKRVIEDSLLLESIIENVVDAIITINSKGIILTFNQAAEKIFGYEAKVMIGQSVTILMPSPHQENHHLYVRDYLETGKAKVIGIGREIVGKRSDATEFPMHLSVSKVFRQGDEIIFAGVVRDLSQQKELEKTILEEQAKVAHASKLSAVGELSAGVGHEINNPLTILISKFERIKNITKENISLASELKSPYLDIDHALSRITNIVRGLRTFAKSDSEEMKVFDLVEACQQTYSFIHEIYKKEEINISLNSNSDNIFIEGNPGRVQQVIMNLLTNAKDAVINSPRKYVTISIIEKSESVYIKVNDTGPGINDDDRENIFQSFYTTKEEGTGIGLALSSSIMKEHKGEISFESGIEGTTFKITFPKVAPPFSLIDKHVNQTPLIENFDYNVLIIDDERGVRESLADLLSPMGCQIEQADDADQAIKKIQEGDFDFLFVDMKMPKIDGPTLITKIVKEEMAPHSKIIMMTGGIGKKIKELKKENPYFKITNIIYKPFKRDDILKIFNEQINQKFSA